MTDDELVAALETIRSNMIAVATGGPRIQDVNERYQQTFGAVARLARRRIDNPMTYGSILGSVRSVESGDLPSYSSDVCSSANSSVLYREIAFGQVEWTSITTYRLVSG